MKQAESYTTKPDSEKSPERLEAEVNATRARIDDRLETLSSRLSPGDLLDQVLGVVREHGGDFSRNLGHQMKTNPVPTILTSVGLAWLMIGSGTQAPRYATDRSRYRDDLDEFDSAVSYPNDVPGYENLSGSDYEPGVMQKAKDAIDELGDQAGQLKRSARQKIHGASQAAQRGMRSARYNAHAAQDSLSNFLHEQPVLAASLGVALGAALGALLPSTHVEERVLGQASEKVVEKAEAVASAQYGKVKATVQEVAEHTRQVLQEDNSHQSQEQADASAARSSQMG